VKVLGSLSLLVGLAGFYLLDTARGSPIGPVLLIAATVGVVISSIAHWWLHA
jgi:hypothetical protein